MMSYFNWIIRTEITVQFTTEKVSFDIFFESSGTDHAIKGETCSGPGQRPLSRLTWPRQNSAPRAREVGRWCHTWSSNNFNVANEPRLTSRFSRDLSAENTELDTFSLSTIDNCSFQSNFGVNGINGVKYCFQTPKCGDVDNRLCVFAEILS